MSASPMLIFRDDAPRAVVRRPLDLSLPLMLLLLGPATLAVLRLYPDWDLLFPSPGTHFWLVTATTLFSVALALLMLRIAVVRRDGRVLLISSSFLALSATFLVHAISTPGVIFQQTVHATAWSTPLALFLSACMLALSVSDRFAQQPWLLRYWRHGLALGSALMLAYGWFMLFYVPQHSMPTQPASAPPVQVTPPADSAHGESHNPSIDESSTIALSFPTLQDRIMGALAVGAPLVYGGSGVLFVGVAVVYGRRWRRTPTRPLATMSCSAILLAQTALVAYVGVLWQLSFWLYHLVLLSAVLTATYGIVSTYEQSGSFSKAVEGLFLGATLQRQHMAFQSGMEMLLQALERSDASLLPQLRGELKQRFALADDQIDLLEHAVSAVTREREEQRRLRTLVAVGRAATSTLDPDQLLHGALTIFATQMDLVRCGVGFVQNEHVFFAAQHWFAAETSITDKTLQFPMSALPAAWRLGDDSPMLWDGDQPVALRSSLINTTLLIPLRHHEALLGVLLVQARSNHMLDERMTAVCSAVGTHLATAFTNARLYGELQYEHERLRRSEDAREQLSQMVVHDLKNPLTALRGYLSLLRVTDPTPQQHELLVGAERSSIVMQQLVNDLLDLAKLEEGKLELHRTLVEPAKLLQGCISDLRPWLEQEHKQIITDVAATVPLLNIDGTLMRRVLINLLSNAIKHTPDNTSIELSIAADPEGLQLRVRDFGRGIAPELLPTLFERFSATLSQGKLQSNTGLGLSFCKLAVEAHGGTISVESTSAKGSTFIINLPLEAVAEPVAA